MTDLYKSHSQHYIALDCIIFGFDQGQLKLLLIKRIFEPELGSWSLIGGFLQGTESLDQAAERILSKHTGLNNIYMEQIHSFGEVMRDPEDRVVSVAYSALIKIDSENETFNPIYTARWFTLDQIPELVFDHKEMIEKALSHLRFKARYRPIGFELLPEKFTIPQLQQLYESIYQKEYDRRNFSKKIRSMGLLIKLDEKQKGFSKKGAWLYRFDSEKYEQLLQKGFNFELG